MTAAINLCMVSVVQPETECGGSGLKTDPSGMINLKGLKQPALIGMSQKTCLTPIISPEIVEASGALKGPLHALAEPERSKIISEPVTVNLRSIGTGFGSTPSLSSSSEK